MFKKFLILLTACAMLLSAAACAKKTPAPDTPDNSITDDTPPVVDQPPVENDPADDDKEPEFVTATFRFVKDDGNVITGNNVAHEHDYTYYTDYTIDSEGKITIEDLAKAEYNLLHLEDDDGGELARANFYFVKRDEIDAPKVDLSDHASVVISLPSYSYHPVLTVTFSDGYLNCIEVE